MNPLHTTIKVAYIGSLSIINVVVNSIVIVVIAKYPQLREDRTNLFMLSLMIGDGLYGLVIMPPSALLCSSASQSVLVAMPYLPNVVMLFSRWFCMVGLNSLAWVTVSKMIAITKPFVYERHLNSTRCYIIIGLIWSVGFVIGLASFRVETTWSTSVCMPRLILSSTVDNITDLSFLVIAAVIPLILIVYGTTKIFMVIVRTHQQITSQVQSMGGEQGVGGQSTSATLQSIRSGKNVLIICASIVLLIIPTFGYDIYASVSGRKTDEDLTSFIAMWVGPLNTVVNSILFVCLYRYVREKTRQMLKGLCVCIMCT